MSDELVEIADRPIARWSREQVELIKRTVARGATDDELAMFLHVCQRTGLDPFVRQLYGVKRYDRTLGREVMAIQTGIDGYRLVAERTGRYAPGRAPTYRYRTDGSLEAATAYVKKQTADGTWHEVEAEAWWDEYVQHDRESRPTRFWQRMPRLMLAKVAEALALRRAFPAELSGLYTQEEMDQATIPTVPASIVSHDTDESPAPPAALPHHEPEAIRSAPSTATPISEPQQRRLFAKSKAGNHSTADVKAWLETRYGYAHTTEILRTDYDAICTRLENSAPLGSLPEDLPQDEAAAAD